ncbi:response regulator transcription factor [Aestuariimicrobium ganziense]|uniref:response regulator transcription factor n=1 Tax=Aestuariimicrobium ganziense TaxID=2773677 RepID=UPI001941B7C9|nr:response regulator transcription factor [Aestuariimicrobium ganziense]
MSRILIAEDESRIASFIHKGLKNAGYSPVVVDDGFAALQLATHGEFDLMILDVGLPEMDGFEVLRRLRGQGGTIPVIMLTARSSAVDTIAGLEGGADDYMGKPFSFEELLARVKLRLRPATQATAAPEEATSRLQVGDVTLDLHSREVSVDGETHDLSAREFTMLETFLRNPRRVLSREQLLSRVWGYDFDPNSNVVDVYVGYLRKKVGAARIATVRGMGYRLEA